MNRPILFLLLAVMAAPSWAEGSARDRQTLEYLQSTRHRINQAGKAGDTTRLVSIRGEVLAKLSTWPAEESPCRAALASTEVFLKAAIDKRPRAIRDDLAQEFRANIADCRNTVRSYSADSPF